jgi:hypothetical protein
MIWLSWRQQRTETLITAGLLALLTAILVPEALHLASLYDRDGVAGCLRSQSPACHQTIADFGGHAGILRSLIAWFTLLPGLIGIALAAPVLLDVESGTFRLAWTQSVTRGRWIATRFSLAVVTALVAAGVLAVLFTWYRAPLDRVYGRMDGSNSFDLEGTVLLGYALFALAVALAVGVVWRRATAAMIVAFGAYIASRLFVDGWLRQRLITPLSATWNIDARGPNLDHAWVLWTGPSDRAGHPCGGGYGALQACARTTGNGFKGLDPHCLARHGAGYNHAVYIPASSFWHLQALETALFAGAAVVLLGFAAWWLRRRTA